VNDVFVPEERTMSWRNPRVHRPGALYALPYVFAAKVAAVPLGSACGALEAFKEMARKAEGRQFVEEGRLTPAVAMAEQAHVSRRLHRRPGCQVPREAYLFEGNRRRLGDADRGETIERRAVWSFLR
jgi:hypothetical protein